MKKVIKCKTVNASEYTEEMPTIDSVVDTLENIADHAGYTAKLEFEDGPVPIISLIPEDRESRPDIEVQTVKDGDTFVFYPNIKFGNVKYDERTYPDHIDYVLKDWKSIVPLIKHISMLEINPDDYADTNF